MMDRELCFYIEGNALYLEQVLVDYNSIPIFFVCRDENEAYYLVLCTDVEEFKYIVIGLSDTDLYCLLHGILTMRDVFIKQKYYWEVTSEEQIELDSVIRKSMDKIDCSALPDEGAYFEILTDEISLYAKRFDDAFLSKENFKSLQQELNFVESILNERCEFNDEFIERFIDLCDCQSQQKVTVDFQTEKVDYEEYMNAILRSDKVISEKMSSEEWRATEMNILAYAA